MNNEKVNSLQQARDKIDQIDVALIELIASRQFYVDQAMRHKQTVEDVQSPQRVKEVIEKSVLWLCNMQSILTWSSVCITI